MLILMLVLKRVVGNILSIGREANIIFAVIDNRINKDL